MIGKSLALVEELISVSQGERAADSYLKDGRIIQELKLPIGGRMSIGSLEETAKELISTKEVFRTLGCPLEEPLWTIGFLTFSALIELRVTVSGVYDVRKGEIVFDAHHPIF